MEPSKEKWQGNYKRYKNSYFSTRSRNPDFKPRNSRYSNCKSSFIGRRYFLAKKGCEPKKVSVEDAEEEERRKKLSDTANKLLNKIKIWSAENNDKNESNETEKLEPENSEKDSEGKYKRIAHFKKTKQVKKKVPVKTKHLKSQSELSEYDVNKATVKDFQNRIQHKLINEIMQMPKENLQNVLNDPKINPIMEVKMSRLVKENKPLIAQKLRALAEAKMTSNDSPSNPQLLVDIDKLIDPVIETDLSVLPFELIKQMENIFQVQFDYSNEKPESTSVPEDEFSFENDCGDIEEGVEDLRMYECSTDEDEEFGSNKQDNVCDATTESELTLEKEILVDKNTKEVNEVMPQPVCSEIEKECVKKSSKRELKQTDSTFKKIKLNVDESNTPPKVTEAVESALALQTNSQTILKQTNSEAEERNFVLEPEVPPLHSTLCKSISTQTSSTSLQPPLLYGLPLPQQSPDSRPELLLEEVHAIHKLIGKLNERRFRIFLDLLKDNSSNCLSDDFPCDNFIETFSSGNMFIAESLVDFFKNKQLIGEERRSKNDDVSQHWRHQKKKRKKPFPKKY